MGKVHGSLARAGKVKGQTPKVAKQEKTKKQKTGRARMRERYKKRVLALAGDPNARRKGPNAQN